ASVERAQAQVAVGNERAQSDLRGQRHRLPIISVCSLHLDCVGGRLGGQPEGRSHLTGLLLDPRRLQRDGGETRSLVWAACQEKRLADLRVLAGVGPPQAGRRRFLQRELENRQRIVEASRSRV